MVSQAGIPSSAHVSLRIRSIHSVFGLRSVLTTALDSDERLHSEVGLKQERESTTDLDIIQSGLEKATREGVESGESADKRL